MLELKNDYYTHSFGKKISNEIFNMLPVKECIFCGSKLNPDKADFYQHNGGWQTSLIKEKIWIWFTCPKCGDQRGINYLGFKKDNLITLAEDLEIISQIPEILINQARGSSDKVRTYYHNIQDHLNKISKLNGDI